MTDRGPAVPAAVTLMLVALGLAPGCGDSAPAADALPAPSMSEPPSERSVKASTPPTDATTAAAPDPSSLSIPLGPGGIVPDAIAARHALTAWALRRQVRMFDRDGDGALSNTERADHRAVRAAALQTHRDRLAATLGPAAAAFSESDLVALDVAFRQRAALDPALMRSADLSGDGFLDDHEADALVQYAADGAIITERRFLLASDADGDGTLTADEAAAALAALSTIARSPARDQLDHNLDGVIDWIEIQAFAQAYTAGDPAADINGDGQVNAADAALVTEQVAGP